MSSVPLGPVQEINLGSISSSDEVRRSFELERKRIIEESAATLADATRMADEQHARAELMKLRLDKLRIDDVATAMLIDHPNWTSERIATEIGCARNTLCRARTPRFIAARAKQKEARRDFDKPRDKGGRGGDVDRDDR